MADAPFRYDACTPWSDGKRRARDSAGNTHVLLCNDAPGDLPVRTYREQDGLAFVFTAGGVSYGSFHLVGPAPEAPREWWVNVYSNGAMRAFFTQEDAGMHANCYHAIRTECVRVVEARS